MNTTLKINNTLIKFFKIYVNKHRKTYSALLVIRELQIKITTRYHFTLIRMTIIKKMIISERMR